MMTHSIITGMHLIWQIWYSLAMLKNLIYVMDIARKRIWVQ